VIGKERKNRKCETWRTICFTSYLQWFHII